MRAIGADIRRRIRTLLHVAHASHNEADPIVQLRGWCSECVRGRLPVLEALRDELGPLFLAPAVQHLEV
jgi:hypothetical protein